VPLRVYDETLRVLKSAVLCRADLHGADLFGANLHRVDLSQANLSGADLTYANLHGVGLSKADLTQSLGWLEGKRRPEVIARQEMGAGAMVR
jgi:uncharacterized protein YjbI with pentapeptide repeats